MSSSADYENLFSLPISSLEYRDLAGNPLDDPMMPGTRKPRAEVEMSKEELEERLRRERTDAIAQTEVRLRQDYESKLQSARAPIAASLSSFQAARNEYFARVEAEVIQLALSIAAKILHRESQVDPMLVATLVRMAIDKMREGSSVTIRVGPGQAAKWKQHFGAQSNGHRIEIVEDSTLSIQDCVLETELGSANFGLDSQLKEVEKGFFDLLALRPAK